MSQVPTGWSWDRRAGGKKAQCGESADALRVPEETGNRVDAPSPAPHG